MISAPPVGAAQIQAELATASSTPIHVLLELTSRCVESCRFCYKRAAPRELELSTGEVRALLADLASLGCLMVDFSGGEVLLRQDLKEIVAAARELNFAVQILTTGQLLTRDTVGWMYELGVRSVQVALHGADPAMHDGTVRTAGAFGKVRQAVELLQEFSIRTRLACVITRSNHTLVPRIMEVAESWHVPLVLNDSLMSLQRFAERVEDFELNESELACFFCCSPRITTEACTPDGGQPEPSQLVCGAARSVCSVTEDGTLYACSHLRVPAGSIRQHPLRELWRSAPYLAHVRSLRKIDLPRCLACEHRPYCTPCIGLNQDRTGSLVEPSPRSCMRARVRHALATERGAGSP